MSWTRKRIIATCLLVAALGLMLFPPWRGQHAYVEHRLLWNHRSGSPDWGQLVLELCLLVVIGALAVVVVSMAERSSTQALKRSFRRAGLLLVSASILIAAAIAGYDGFVHFTQLREYNRKIREFQANVPLLQQAFPLSIPEGDAVSCTVSNIHEAEAKLSRLQCPEQNYQWVAAQFLSAPGYRDRTVTFALDKDGCVIGTHARSWTFAPVISGERKAVSFEFWTWNEDSAKQFFSPLPGWYAEALEHNIDVYSVPEWMKPGTPPAPWPSSDWLGNRGAWIILTLFMLVLGGLSFIAARRIDKSTTDQKRSVEEA